MNHGPLIFFGVFAGLALSWFSFILTPIWQIGGQQPDVLNNLTSLDTRTNWVSTERSAPVAKPGGMGSTYPTRSGTERQGLEVYRAQGCVYCHTQQIRGFPADLLRWGARRTVAQDYLFDNPVQIGAVRIGPDLTNVGLRQASKAWHLLHLYNPRALVKGSTMPPYRHLFEKRKVRHQRSADALIMPANMAIEPDYEVVPRPEALVLVDYLVGLQVNMHLFEAPIPGHGLLTNAPANTVTNLTGTNLPATNTTPAPAAP